MVPRLVGQEDQKEKQGTRTDRGKRHLGAMGLWLLGRVKKRERERERSWCSDVNGAQQRLE